MESGRNTTIQKDDDETKASRVHQLNTSTHAKILLHVHQVTIYENYQGQSTDLATSLNFSPVENFSEDQGSQEILLEDGASSQPDSSTSLLTDSFLICPIKKTPLKHLAFNLYEKLEGHVLPTFHDVYKIKKCVQGKKASIYFFKRNRFNANDSLMYELEAVCCAFYQLIAPDHVAPAKALFQKETGKYVGVASKAIPGFKSTMEDPLKEEDLNILALKHFSIEEIENIDLGIQQSRLVIDNLDDNQILFERVPSRIVVTVKDLKNYRIVKGLGIGLTASYFFEEDDLHRGNMSKEGKRIDFDMSCWTILYHFKETGFIDWTFRHPTGRFNFSEKDILNFPNLEDCQPFYWPTKPAPYIPQIVIDWLKCAVSKNAFTTKENLVYQKLAKHCVFIHYKFATLFRILLISEEIYIQTAKLHLREEIKEKFGFENEEKFLYKILAQHQTKRTQELSDLLIEIPQFIGFVEKYGDYYLKDCIQLFNEHNQQLTSKLATQPEYQFYLINTANIKMEFVKLKKRIEARSVKPLDDELNCLFNM